MSSLLQPLRALIAVCLILPAVEAGAASGGREGPPLAFRVAMAEAMPPDAAAFYRARGHEPVWIGEAGAARLAALMAAVDRAADHGLPAERWDVEGLRARLAAVSTAADVARMEGEVTRLYLDYATAMTSGVLEPSEVAPSIVREIARPDPVALMDRIAGDEPRAALRALVPSSPGYGRLMRQRARLSRVIEAGGWGPAVEGGGIEPGQGGPAVLALRDRLVAMGMMERSLSPDYDAALERGVARFQSLAGLEPDGVAGPETLAALNVPARARLGQVLVAMERERWTNFDRGTRHVWVNLVDFSAAVVDRGEVTFRTRAVIGKDTDGRETPEFSDVMDHMVINPSWYVPRSIIVGEYLPKLRANPWAVRHLEMTDSRGRRVNRARGFSQYSARSFPFAMRQPPGPSNALGQVKFMFPNVHNIYLHDTPQKHLFAHDRRAYSHGCIRLAEPQAFAHVLLAPQEEDPEGTFERLLRRGSEARVDLDAPVPVHLVYRTAFTDALGTLHLREDVYGRDAAILEALTAEGVALPGAPA